MPGAVALQLTTLGLPGLAQQQPGVSTPSTRGDADPKDQQAKYQ